MNRIITLTNRMREVLLDGHWSANTNNKQSIQSFIFHLDTQNGISNTVIALTYHINY